MGKKKYDFISPVSLNVENTKDLGHSGKRTYLCKILYRIK